MAEEENTRDLGIEFDGDKKLFIMKNSGHRSYSTVRSALHQLRDKITRQDVKFKILMDWSEFKGFNAENEDALRPSEIQIAEMVSRIAIVTSKEWEQEAHRILTIFPYIESNIFGPGEQLLAEHWLVGNT